MREESEDRYHRYHVCRDTRRWEDHSTVIGDRAVRRCHSETKKSAKKFKRLRVFFLLKRYYYNILIFCAVFFSISSCNGMDDRHVANTCHKYDYGE